MEIEDLEPEENNAGVNPLPVDCPLLLVDLRRVRSSDIDAVLQECHRERKFPSTGYSKEVSGSCAETPEEQVIEIEGRRTDVITEAGENESREQGTRNCTDTFKNVVNLSKRVLSEPELSLLSKGLKFCPTPEKVDMYALRKDIKNYVRRIRLKEYFYAEDEGDFSEFPAFRKKSVWTPEKK